MIPIFEQGNSKGIGHSFESFVKRFIEICNNHKKEERASGFGFIFYDFRNKSIRAILKSTGGFARLDRLSGRDLSIFYLNSDKPKTIDLFNKVFQRAFEIDNDISYPFVLLFDVRGDEVEDIKIVVLEQDNPLFAFEELYSIIENHKEKLISGDQTNLFIPKINKIFGLEPKDYKKIAITEFIKLVLKEAYKSVYYAHFNIPPK